MDAFSRALQFLRRLVAAVFSLWHKLEAILAVPGVRRFGPSLEALENRIVPVVWSMGPAPQVLSPNPTGSYGPVAGLVNALALVPGVNAANPRELLLGSNYGGLWGSTDYFGATPQWAVLSDNWGLRNNQIIDPTTGLGAGALSIQSIAYDPNNTNIIFVGTGTASGTGLFRSIDRGRTWQLVSTGTATRPLAFFHNSITRIIVDPRPDFGNNVYLAVGGAAWGFGEAQDWGIYKSEDSGVTWAKITSDFPGQIGNEANVTDLEYTFTASSQITLFAGVKFANGVGGRLSRCSQPAEWPNSVGPNR
jgi:hypothetical protein